MGLETSSQEQQLRLALTTPAPPVTAPEKTTPVSTKTTALAPGFRFHPTDEELVIYYLKRKVSNKPFRFNAISEVDIYKNEPWDLAGNYFFPNLIVFLFIFVFFAVSSVLRHYN